MKIVQSSELQQPIPESNNFIVLPHLDLCGLNAANQERIFLIREEWKKIWENHLSKKKNLVIFGPPGCGDIIYKDI